MAVVIYHLCSKCWYNLLNIKIENKMYDYPDFSMYSVFSIILATSIATKSYNTTSTAYTTIDIETPY